MPGTLMGFVGDVLVNRDDPHEVFGAVRDVLREPKVLFANLEGVYTDDPRPVPTTLGLGVSAPARNLDAYARAGFNVMSLANNHVLDVGYEAMLETRSRLRAQGVRTCGAGDNLADAHEPAVLEVDELRIAVLAYACIFPVGYEARSGTPGLAPVRAYNFWRDPYPTVHMPGIRPIVTTVPDQGDLAYLATDLRRARERADLVIASFHWGDMWCPFRLTDHETRTARYCIDQGADMVVGHHHHAIRGMEWYRGKPIMYGLGHFVYDQRVEWTEQFKKEIAELFPGDSEPVPYVVAPREGWPLLPMHEDCRMTMMAWATAGRDGVTDIGFLPCGLRPDGRVHPLEVKSPEGRKVLEYFEKCNRTQGLKAAAVTEGAPKVGGLDTVRVVAT